MPSSESIAMWQLDGNCVHHEWLGKNIMEFCGASDGQRSYLVINTGQDLLITP